MAHISFQAKVGGSGSYGFGSRFLESHYVDTNVDVGAYAYTYVDEWVRCTLQHVIRNMYVYRVNILWICSLSIVPPRASKQGQLTKLLSA